MPTAPTCAQGAFAAALTVPLPTGARFAAAHAISANGRCPYDLGPSAALLRYAPRDNADAFFSGGAHGDAPAAGTAR